MNYFRGDRSGISSKMATLHPPVAVSCGLRVSTGALQALDDPSVVQPNIGNNAPVPVDNQCFCFQILIKYFWDAYCPKDSFSYDENN